MRKSVYILMAIFLFSCQAKKEKQEAKTTRYAKRYTYTRHNDYVLLTITTVSGERYEYRLIKNANEEKNKNDIVVPIQKIVCMSTTYMPMLEALNVENSLIGFPSPMDIRSAKTKTRVAQAFVQDVGKAYLPNMEKIWKLNPDVVMAYPTKNSAWQKVSKPILMNVDYEEEHPLGKAEWIKVFGLLYDKEKEADSIFSTIEKSYQNKIQREQTVTLWSGNLYGDLWYLPGGKSYLAQLFADAGFDYQLKNDAHTGSLGITLEQAYRKGRQADIWVGVGEHVTKNSMLQRNKKYALFRAFERNQVYTYFPADTATRTYFDWANLRPDWLLQDLIHIRKGNDSLIFLRKVE